MRAVFALAFVACGAAHGAQPSATVASAAPQNVLVIDSERHGLPAARAFEAGLRELSASPPGAVEFFVEHLDDGRFPGEQAQQAFARYLQARYAGRRIDVVVAFSDAAAELALQVRSQQFPRVPVIIAAVGHKWFEAQKLPAGVVAVAVDYDYRGTLELALALQPDMREVVVVHGVTEYDRARLDEARQALEGFVPRLRYRTIGHLSLAAIEAEVRRLPPTSAVLHVSMVRNAEGSPVDGPDFAGRLAAASAVPVYATFEAYLNRGELAGVMFDFGALGRATAAAVKQILSGADALAMQTVNATFGVPLVNWQALQRWNIPESRIPANAQIRLRPVSPWNQYRIEIMMIGMVIIVLAVLLTALLLELARRRRTENALRESESRVRNIAAAIEKEHAFLRQIIDISPNFIFAKDRAGRFTLANKAVADAYGTTVENLLGKTDADFDSNAREVEHFHRVDMEVLDTLQERFIAEEQITDAQGNVRWLQTVKRPILDKDGSASQVLGASTDITRRKLAEADAQRNRNELAHVTRVSAMGELASSLAHELNQPLTAILSNAQAAQRFMAADSIDVTEVRETLGDVVQESTRASEIIRHMRALVKKGELEIVPLDPASLVHDVVKLVHSDAIVRGMRVVLDCAADLPAVRGDRVQLQQVLLNLLLNAFDAMTERPQGDRVVTVEVTPDGAAGVRIAVRDGGSGLSGDKLDGVFKPFFTTKRDGLGLGLSISRSIIEAHGARLHARNNADRGATFHFTLPVAGAAAAAPAGQPA